MKDSSPSSKRRCYDAAFRAEAIRLAGESRSTQAAARALNIWPRWMTRIESAVTTNRLVPT